jgi:hypothetical protein
MVPCWAAWVLLATEKNFRRITDHEQPQGLRAYLDEDIEDVHRFCRWDDPARRIHERPNDLSPSVLAYCTSGHRYPSVTDALLHSNTTGFRGRR